MRFLFIVLLAALALAFTACDKGENQTEEKKGKSEAPEEPKKMTVDDFDPSGFKTIQDCMMETAGSTRFVTKKDSCLSQCKCVEAFPDEAKEKNVTVERCKEGCEMVKD